MFIFRNYQEQERKQLELEEQYNRIENQLNFEREHDTTSTHAYRHPKIIFLLMCFIYNY
jgi:hypothetical protein